MGYGPCNFELELLGCFLSLYWGREDLLWLDSANTCWLGETPSFSPIYTSSRVSFRLGFCLAKRLPSVSMHLCVLVQCSTACSSTYRITPLSIKFILHPQFLMALLVLTCFSNACRTSPFGQADRAPAGSVTSGDWFSDCIGAAYVCIVVGSPRSTPLDSTYHHLIESSDTFALSHDPWVSAQWHH